MVEDGGGVVDEDDESGGGVVEDEDDESGGGVVEDEVDVEGGGVEDEVDVEGGGVDVLLLYELVLIFPFIFEAVYTLPLDVTATPALLPFAPVTVVTFVENPSV